MAAGSIQKPGTQHGPCAGSCNHRDCAALWEIINSICSHCGEKIGYDRRFYDTEDGGHEHASCAESAIERERTGAA